ncbi:mitochondrial ribosomal protein L55 [Arctopsyche grandis]|uniref:mitochondrial ribosomal protein L55 n=1 Tax=Arctopsyche grandis TaxID=121162 RepID=UPI00406DA414
MFKQLSTVNIMLLNNINAISTRGLSAVTASITRTRRAIAPRMYPTVLVLPDGASINIRYHEPRKIVRLPLDLANLTEDERKVRLESRKPKKKVKISEDVDDNFDANKYLSRSKKTSKR